ncbi:hypothetical protein H072_1249 [Dactylellina haptotyla CBS 200.50]|uniref:Uncharacterized protein n=1 Tax=Dactylellina haptotyla (strain CBS 200.50) TaxID=1284197 RepID=S8AUV3_DACHA|nr:hypothetical protein H072_1249 [Dactylellina haptotyla CBS 200.50]
MKSTTALIFLAAATSTCFAAPVFSPTDLIKPSDLGLSKTVGNLPVGNLPVGNLPAAEDLSSLDTTNGLTDGLTSSLPLGTDDLLSKPTAILDTATMDGKLPVVEGALPGVLQPAGGDSMLTEPLGSTLDLAGLTKTLDLGNLLGGKKLIPVRKE